MEFKTLSRADRSSKQEDIKIKLIPLSKKSAIEANKVPYKRRVIDAGNHSEAARLVEENAAIKENSPNNDPGPYKLGVGDIIEISISDPAFPKDKIDLSVVTGDGYISVLLLDRVKALGKTQAELED